MTAGLPSTVTALRRRAANDLALASALLACRAGFDELDLYLLRGHALGIIARWTPLIGGGLFAPLDGATLVALELAAEAAP